jgi:O-antigen ligase
MHMSKLSLNVPKEVSSFIVPFLSLFFLAVFVATNGVGSSGILVIFAYIAWFEPELRKRWWKIVWPWLLAILIYFVLMSFHAFSKVTALRDGVEVIKGVALSLVALYLLQFSEHQLRRIMVSVVGVLTVITICIVGFNLYQHSVVDFIHNQEFDWYMNRNSLGVGFSVTTVFIAALMVVEESRSKSILLSAAWMIVVIAAVLNGSRGAMMGMGAATICIILAALSRVGWKQVFRIELWLLPISIVFTMFSWAFYKHIDLHQFFVHNVNGVNTGLRRFDIWKVAIEKISYEPWIGYGTHAMKLDPMLSVFRSQYGVDYPHSIYVGLVYASGIVGVLFWLIWFVSFSNRIKRNFKANNDLSYYIGIGLLVNILVHGLVDFDLYMYSVFTYITVGLVILLPRVSHQGFKR